MAIDPNTGWALGPLGQPSQSTTQPMPTPAQVSSIQQATAAMAQPAQPAATQQQNSMLSGLFGGSSPQYLPSGSSIPGAVGPTSVNGMPLNAMGPTSINGLPLG